MRTDRLRTNQLPPEAYRWYLDYLGAMDRKDVGAYGAFLAENCCQGCDDQHAATPGSAGLGVRRRRPGGRPRQAGVPAAAGRAARQVSAAAAAGAFAGVTEVLSPDEVRTVLPLLRRLPAALDRARDADAAPAEAGPSPPTAGGGMLAGPSREG